MVEAFDRRRPMAWVVAFATLGALAWIFSATQIADASSGGIAGYSGNPDTNGGATCSQCHSGGVAPTVTLDGPTSVTSGETATYTLTIVGGAGGGFDVSVTDGTLVAGSDSRIAAGPGGDEVVHSGTKPTTGGEVSWTFEWTAPPGGGDVTMYGAGNAANSDFGLGGDGVATDTLTISVTERNIPPVADAGGPYEGDPTVFVTFDGSGSSDSDGSIVDWEWDFGDGTTSSGQPTLFHSYVEAGVYTVTLTVTDNGGAEDSATTTATIGDVSNLPPTADAGGPYSGTAGEPIDFDGSGSSDPEGATLTYAWDFGDGGTATTRRPSHTYSAAGTYTVTLTVFDDATLSSNDTATATVAAAPTTTTTTQPPSASALYSSNCAGCHGGNGQGGVGPSLQTSSLSTSQIQSVISGGAAGMPGYSATLSSSEISSLASFTKGLQNPSATTTAAPEGGAALYSSKCAGCHGAAGAGGAGPSLQASSLSTSEISAIVSAGAAGMPGYSSSLSAAQINAVSTYTKGLQDSGATTTTLDPSSGGGATYASQCAGCHGTNGEGGLGPSLQDSTLQAAEIETVIANGVGTMPGYEGRLTPEQITELAAFTAGLQGGAPATTAPPGGGDEASLLYNTHCAACHGVEGEGGIGPALANTSLAASDIAALINAGRGVMPAFDSVLSPEEVEVISNYVTTIGQGAADPSVSDETAELYASLCAGCHGDGGQGASGPALVGTSLDEAGLIAIIANGQGGMPGYSGQISESQIADLAGLIGALQQGHGGDGGGDDPPSTTRAVVGATTEAPDSEEGGGESATRTLGIILVALVMGAGTYLAFANRATRER